MGKKRIRMSIFLVFFAAFICLFRGTAAADDASERDGKTIRVGYPIQDGLTMKDSEGNYSGYTYDYLLEISQYTGWNYEFITPEGGSNEQISECMQMLKNGEIDLIGGTYYDESLTESYSYPGSSYGNNYMGIFVPYDSNLTETTIYTSGLIRVGVYNRNGEKNQKLEQFSQMNKLNIEQVVERKSIFDYRNMIADGRADAILSTDLAMSDHTDMHAVVRFSPRPFYFAAKKGNVDIVRQLDFAISTIDRVNPNFMVQLYNEYFYQYASKLHFTDEEKAFIKSCGTLEVVMYSKKPPFQYIDSKTGQPAGVTVEILDYISETTGLKFHYNMVPTHAAYMEEIKSGRADIAGDMFLNYLDASEMKSTLTLPWHVLPIYLVFDGDTSPGGTGRYAIPYYFRNIIKPPADVVYYDTAEECMEAVKKGQADYCYTGEFSSQYLFNSGRYNDLKFLNQSDSMTQKLSFGICDASDHTLLSVFNKAITYLPSEKTEEIIYRNTYQQQSMPLTVILENNKTLVIALVMGLLALLFLIYIYVKNREQQRVAFENKRYQMISNLANEYFYEYNVREDKLILSEKCADFFGCVATIPMFAKQFRAQSNPLPGIWQFGAYITADNEEGQEVSCEMPDQSRQWFKIISSVIYNKKQQIYVAGKITDIQDIKSEQIRLEQKASIDGLTGIYNITTIKGLIKKHLEEYDGSASSALIILDIDNFKQINDSFGHYNGDVVLAQVANLISDIFKKQIPGRLGGDEFVIFTEGIDREGLERQCGILCRTFTERINTLLGMPATLSIGITFALKGQNYEELYREADAALYKMKSDNKNGYSVYEKSKEAER